MVTETARKKPRLIKRDIPQKLRLPATLLLGALTGLGLSLASTLITVQSLRLTLTALWETPLYILACALFLALATLFLTLLTRSLFAGGLAVSIVALVISIISYFKNLIAQTPLQLPDFRLIGKLGRITELNSASLGLSRNTLIAVIGVVLWLVALFLLSRPLRLSRRLSLPCALAPLAAFILCFCVRPVADGWLFTPLETPLDAYYTPSYVAGRTGPLLVIWRSVIIAGDTVSMTQDEALESARLMVEEGGGGRAAGQGVDPNIIVVLSESFFDLTKLPGVTYDADPLADFHRAQAEGVSGTFYTHTLGYGTAGIEIEIFTGINTRCLLADSMLNEWAPKRFEKLPTVMDVLKERGYYASYLHTFNDGIYDRSSIYTRLGFDELFFSDGFAAIDPKAAAAGDGYWAYLEDKLSGGAYSDDYLAELMISLYERENENGPVFLFGTTMENHTPYSADKYASYDYSFTSPLSGEGEELLNAVTQGAANSSKALGKLTEYFSACDEPTIIVFFGDHRPGMTLETEGGTLFSALGMCPANNWEWSTEQYAELYSTDYVVWANDPALLPAPAGTDDADTSTCFLGLDILRAADVELDSYWSMTASLRDSASAITWPYSVAADGSLGATPEDCLDAEGLNKFNVMRYFMQKTLLGSGTPFELLN